MYRFFIAFILLLCCSGCLDVYIDIIVHQDGSYTIRKMAAIEQSLFDRLNSIQHLTDSSKNISREQMIDTMKNSMQWERPVLEKIKGVTSYDLRDSIHDSTVYFITEIAATKKVALDGLITTLFKSLDGKEHPTDPNTPSLTFKVVSKGNKKIMTVAIPTGKKKPSSEEDKKMVESMFGRHGFHFRVFSPDLLQSSDHNLTVISDGLSWDVPLASLADPSTMRTKSVKFILIPKYSKKKKS